MMGEERMSEKLRQSGIDIIGDIPWGTHFCQFYQTKEDLMDTLIPYLKTGLENNEFCFWVISRPLEVKEAKEALRKAIPDLDAYMGKKQIEITPYTPNTNGNVNDDIFDSEKVISGCIKKLDQALSSGYEGLRLAGNIVSWLEQKDWGHSDHEKKVNASAAKLRTLSLCSYFLDMCSAADIIEIAFAHQFALIKKKGKWELIEKNGKKNVNENERAEEAYGHSEQYMRLSSESIPSPDRGNVSLELAEIVDIEIIKPFISDFYKLTHIPIGLRDLNDNVLVGAGFQDICAKFHRVHPETCKHCIESGIEQSRDILPGEYKLYKCKNNMWDILTPITVNNQHVGNIVAGQFIFDDEPLDYELFRSQARKYGFNEEEYIEALEKVPRLSREAVDKGMSISMAFANMISQLSYSNIKLAQSVAERDNLLETLRKSEEKYRNIIETANEGILLMNAETIATYANKRTAEMLGYNLEEIIGRSVLDFISEEGQGSAKLHLEKRMQGISGSYELKLVHKDGSTLWTLVNAKPLFDKNGKFMGCLSMIVDITERKKTEEKIKTLADAVESSNDAIVTESLEGIITSWNKGAEQIYGYSAKSIIGKDVSILEPASLKGETKQLIDKIKQGERVKDYETIRLKKDSILINVSITLSPVFNDSGKLIAISAIARDITKRVKAEEALAKVEDARKKEIHHRIKNNLQVISSLLDLQAEKLCYKKTIPASEIIEAFRESQNRVISMALIHEELYKGQETDKINFSAYIRKLADNLFQTYSLRGRNIRLLMDLEEDAFFNMDTAVPLGIIVNELVSNSLKHAFTENQKGKILIRLCREEEKSETHRSLFSLTISDNGKGIPENIKFETLESLGLQLVSTLVDQLDGKIEIKREKGAEFKITFNISERD
jgi:PAS domain S-box-containing protein